MEKIEMIQRQPEGYKALAGNDVCTNSLAKAKGEAAYLRGMGRQN